MLTNGLDQKAARLPEMIGHKGCSHRNAFILPVSIKLHRADKVKGDLTDLIRCLGRQSTQKNDCNHFNPCKNRIPADQLQFLDGFCQDLRNNSSHQIC